jgi:hypothetical protein
MTIILLASNKSHSKSEFPELRGPYLGQTPPGLTSEVFAPGIISIKKRNEGTISFSPKLDEVYFTAKNKDGETKIYFSTLNDDKWTPIRRANFTKIKNGQELHPFVSYNGKRVYFTAINSNSPSPRIWYVDRKGKSWGNALKLDSPVNNTKVFNPNQARNGDLYYTDISNLQSIKTYHAPNKSGVYPDVNEVDIEFGHHAYIEPSQNYLVLAARNQNDDRRDNDIYVCFKEPDGTWTTPINLGSVVNSNLNEKSPSITPDGKYLFFGRDEIDGPNGLPDIHWVSTEVIAQLKLAHFKK